MCWVGAGERVSGCMVARTKITRVSIGSARLAWDRAERMLADLSSHAHSPDEHAFEDRLPYVLDLLGGRPASN